MGSSEKQKKAFDREGFAALLNDIIKKLGITKQDFAKEAGIRNTNLSRYLTGKLLQPPHFTNLQRIANASGDPEHVFPELLKAAGYESADYDDYTARQQKKEDAMRKIENDVWEACRKLAKMSPEELNDIFGCDSISAVTEKYQYQEVVQIMHANLANGKIGMVARPAEDVNAVWGVITSWNNGIYGLLMEHGKYMEIREEDVEWHPEKLNLKNTSVIEVENQLSKINHPVNS